jgi:hypothetical protein
MASEKVVAYISVQSIHTKEIGLEEKNMEKGI